MPLPADVEHQITAIEKAVEPFNDALIAAFVGLSVSDVPAWATVRDQLEPRLRSVIGDTIRANGAPVDAPFIDAQAARVLTQLETVWNRAANEMRRQIRAVTAQQHDDNRTAAGWLRIVGLVAAGSIVSRSRSIRAAARKVVAAGGRFPRTVLRAAALRFDVPTLGRRVDVQAHMRMIIRTETAKIRNVNAAHHASATGQVLFIRDALIGNDDPCTSVDRRYATPDWIRRNPVAHPNCTREATATQLPDGAQVTLT